MDKLDRLKATFVGDPIDRWAYALWKHFPGEDRNPTDFAKAHVKFQKTYAPDVLKLTPHGSYCTVDWGCKIGPIHPTYGSTSPVKCPIKEASDFEFLEEVDPLDGEFGLQLEGIRRVAKELDDQVPLMMTVFSPFMVASQLDSNILDHARDNSYAIKLGLKIIKKVLTEFGNAALDLGADGLFVASLHSVEGKLTDQQFEELEAQYTCKLLKDVRKRAEFIVFHLHGNNPLFEYVANNYPVDAINWHSKNTLPTIEAALNLFNKGLFGGIDETKTVRTGTPNEIRQQLHEAMQISNSRLLLAPGCVIPIGVPAENLHVVVKTIRNAPSPSQY